jgi:tetratricopeptide (TPR) repeat protein/transglutaminase-like putative cysteine protease
MRRLPIVFALLASSSIAHAGDKVLYQPVPSWVKPAPPIDTAKLGDDAPVVTVLDNQQRIDGGEVIAYVESATRVGSTQAQGQLGTVALSWQPDKGDLTVHRLEILRNGQRIDLIAGRAPFTVLRREERLEQRELDGTLTATMQVPDLRVGDILRVVHSTSNRDRALAGHAQAFLPVLAAPFRATFARSRMIWTDAAAVRLKGYAEGLNLTPVAKGAMREIEIALPLAKQPEVPDDAPLRFQRPPIIEATTFANWAEVSKTMAPLFATEGTILPGSALAAEVEKVKAADIDPLRRASNALRLVQDQVRYQVMGMDGGNYVPQKPAETWSTRYGDCKAKTLLLLAMLRAMGIEAEPVLASLSAGGLVGERLPAPGAFDHVLVRATIGGKTFWLDGTGVGSRLEDIGDTPPLRTVLPLRADGTGLMPVPLRADARPTVIVERTFDDRAGIDLPSVVEVALTMRGAPADALRIGQAQLQGEERRDFVRGLLQRHVGEMQLSEADLSYDEGSGTGTIRAKGVVTTGWRREEGRYRRDVDTVVSGLDFAPDRARAAWHAIPVQTPGPMSVVMRTRVRLPDGGRGFVVEGSTKPSEMLAGAKVTRTVTLKDGLADISMRADGLGSEISPADLPAARAAAAQAKARPIRLLAPRERVPRWITVKSPEARQQIAAIEAIFAKAIADDTKETSGYFSRASLRAGLYDFKGAVADLTRVIELAPEPQVYLKRAHAYRALREDGKAAADLEAALALDPSNVVAIGQLADLRSDAGDTKAALALIDPKIEEGGTQRFGWMATKAQILAEARDGAGATALMDAAISEKPGDPGLLNGRCWAKAITSTALDTALKDCTKAIELAENGSNILDSRAMVYFRLNRLPEALADLDAALELNPNLAPSLFLRGVVKRRMGQAVEGDQDLTGARTIDPRVEATYQRFGIKP